MHAFLKIDGLVQDCTISSALASVTALSFYDDSRGIFDVYENLNQSRYVNWIITTRRLESISQERPRLVIMNMAIEIWTTPDITI